MTSLADRLPIAIPGWLKSRTGLVIVVAALQLLLLASIVADRAKLIKTGREIVLPIVPVDPRDLFKGDYVRLSYPISRVSDVPVTKPYPARDAWAYVTIEPTPDGNWQAIGITANYPATVANGHAVLKAKLQSAASSKTQNLRYGLERYYVPEGTGLALEKMARDKKLAAIVAIDSRGNAAIKGLSVDGKKVYDEPMF